MLLPHFYTFAIKQNILNAVIQKNVLSKNWNNFAPKIYPNAWTRDKKKKKKDH
uniref:ATP synthase F0 subunit 8 n=1 Tax=Romanomermis culicivorax TaxID=13658 RepID=A0A915HLE1_ROMCU